MLENENYTSFNSTQKLEIEKKFYITPINPQHMMIVFVMKCNIMYAHVDVGGIFR